MCVCSRAGVAAAPVEGLCFEPPVTEASVAVAKKKMSIIVLVTVAGPAQPLATCTEVNFHHLWRAGSGRIRILRASAREVGRLVGSHRGVGGVVAVRRQRVALLRLQHLSGCVCQNQRSVSQSCIAVRRPSCPWAGPTPFLSAYRRIRLQSQQSSAQHR